MSNINQLINEKLGVVIMDSDLELPTLRSDIDQDFINKHMVDDLVYIDKWTWGEHLRATPRLRRIILELKMLSN